MPCQLRMSVRSSKVIQHPWEMPILRFQHSPQTHHISLLKYLPKSWEVFCAWLCSCKQQTSTLMQTTDKIKLEADLISTSTVLLFWYLHSQGHWTWLKKVSSQVSATAYSLHGRLVSLFTSGNFDLFSEASHTHRSRNAKKVDLGVVNVLILGQVEGVLIVRWKTICKTIYSWLTKIIHNSKNAHKKQTNKNKTKKAKKSI